MPEPRTMVDARIAPRPRDLFYALLAAAAAAHTGFLVVLTWLRPGLDFGAIVSLMVLPFLLIAVGFLPVIMLLTLLRIALLTLVGAVRARPLLLVAVLSIAGIAIAALTAWLATTWIRDDQIVSSVIFGAAVGGVIAGMKLGGDGREREQTGAGA
ncbi:MAG TPA: hypothetical protein VNA88_06620 [Candidatus Kapabacteria bacterium]|nr:hypothetical protein [Candidatus Kapabacteria bacterium]